MLARPRLVRGESELGYLLRALRNTLSASAEPGRRPQTAPLVDELAAGAASGDDPAQAAELREVHAAISALSRGVPRRAGGRGHRRAFIR